MDPGSHRRTTFMEGVMSIKPVNLQPEDLPLDFLEPNDGQVTGDSSLSTAKAPTAAPGATQSVTGTGSIKVSG